MICSEDILARKMITMSCCQGTLCRTCLRCHVESVVDDARPEMRCPLLPCGEIIPDALVKQALRCQPWTCRNFFGRITKRKLELYEQWCIAIGVAAMAAARMEDVLHCPTDGCRHVWLMPQDLRHRKGENEPANTWDFRSWSLSRQLGFYSPPTNDAGEDLRRVRCPCCYDEYCLLCRRPWTLAGAYISHSDKSCAEYRAAWSDPHCTDDAGAKACPGCGVRTFRIEGCNHMTCTQCRFQWCWECRARWSGRHYACRTSRFLPMFAAIFRSLA